MSVRMPLQLCLWEGFPLRVFYYRQPDDIRHHHEFHELVIVRRGRGMHVTAAGTYPIGRGDVFLILPGEVHTYENVRSLEIVNILYSPSLLDIPLYDLEKCTGYHVFFAARPRMLNPYASDSRLTFPPEQLCEAERLIDEMRGEQEERNPGWEFFMRTAFMRLTGLICRTFSSERVRSSALLAGVGRALRFLEENHRREIRLAELAAVCGRSVSATVRMFRSALGVSPMEYLLEMRLEKAAEKLSLSDDKIGEVAMETGFSDANYFSKMFSRRYGMPPREYRNLTSTPRP